MGLRVAFERGRVSVIAESGDAALLADSRLELSASAWGCAGAMSELGSASPISNRAQPGVSYEHPAGLDEWYSVGPAGIEQGFTIRELPECARRGEPLLIRLRFGEAPGSIAELNATGNEARLSVPGRRSVHYGEPFAQDAAGREHVVRIATDAGLSLSIDVTGAALPLFVDPLIWDSGQKVLANDFPKKSWASNDQFASALSLSSDTVLMGTPGDVNFGRQSGAAYVLVRGPILPGVGMNWAPQQKLKASDARAGARFGSAVAVLGDIALVGAPEDARYGEAAGAAYVYTRSAGVWSEVQRLVPSDAAPNARFGSAVALSDDTLIVGAPSANDGKVYAFVRSGQGWAQQAKFSPPSMPYYGAAVAIVGDTLAIGRDDATGGSVEWFTRNGQAWSSNGAPLASSAPHFGSALAMNAGITVIGGYGDASKGAESGSITISNTSGIHVPLVTLYARDPKAGDQFGRALALSGNTLAVGAPGVDGAPNNGLCPNVPDSGATYVFFSNGTSWSQQVKLGPINLLREDLPPPPTCHPGIRFGSAVVTSSNRVLVGAPLRADFGITTPNTGAAFEFEYLLTNASACRADADCSSGFCVEGVCCNAGCNGPCLSCLAELKDPLRAINGDHVTGRCGEVTADTDPKNGCTSMGTFCGMGDECSGAGASKAANPPGTPCGGPNGVCPTPTSVAGQAVCSSYVCASSFTVDCKRGYLCKAGGCKNDCASNDDCDTGLGFSCKGGQCKVGAGLVGAPCKKGSDCFSTQCVDGICCESACDGECQACDVPDQEGRCLPVSDDPADPPGTCVADGGAAGEGGEGGEPGVLPEAGQAGAPHGDGGSAGEAGDPIIDEPARVECVPACVEGMVCDTKTGQCLDQFVTSCTCRTAGGRNTSAARFAVLGLVALACLRRRALPLGRAWRRRLVRGGEH